MELDQIWSDWKKGVFKPIYWLEGEEPYYIDKLTDYAEKNILTEEQSSFNLTIFYGRDSKSEDVINACRRYPMFSDRQVVILKEAQHMRDLEKLESYMDHPLASTVFVVAHKEKKVDGRKAFGKMLQKKTILFSTKKLYDNEIPDWAGSMIKSKGLDIQPKALHILVEHIGNDLQRIENEIEKLSINLQGRKKISEDDIENFVGVSKEFNIFELQAAMVNKDLAKALNIINYFASNPKIAPIQLVLPTLYAFYSKLYIAAASSSRDEYTIGNLIGLKGFVAKSYVQALQYYSLDDVETALMLLHHYNLKSVGIGKTNVPDAQLIQELVAKIILRS